MTTSKRLISPHFDNTRYCSHHSGVTLIEGGKYITSANGKNRRWICAACDEKRRERKVAANADAS